MKWGSGEVGKWGSGEVGRINKNNLLSRRLGDYWLLNPQSISLAAYLDNLYYRVLA
jgi:hypothetical protein